VNILRSVDETSVVWWINEPTNGEVVQSGFVRYCDIICAHVVDYKDYVDSAELWTITVTTGKHDAHFLSLSSTPCQV